MYIIAKTIYAEPYKIFTKYFCSENVNLFDKIFVTFGIDEEKFRQLYKEHYTYTFIEGVVFDLKVIFTGNMLLDACLSKLIHLGKDLRSLPIKEISRLLYNEYQYSTIYRALYYGLGINRENLHLI